MSLIILLFAAWEPTVSFEGVPREQCPAVASVERFFCVNAVGNMSMNLLCGNQSYLTRWQTGIAIDVDYQFDKAGIPRVTRIKFRLEKRGDDFVGVASPKLKP